MNDIAIRANEKYLGRIRLIEIAHSLSREKLASLCGLKYTRLRNVMGGQAELRISDVAAIAAAFPEYEVWLFTGRTFVESGQVSPGEESTLDLSHSDGPNSDE